MVLIFSPKIEQTGELGRFSPPILPIAGRDTRDNHSQYSFSAGRLSEVAKVASSFNRYTRVIMQIHETGICLPHV
ncbi:hypothetical protein NJ56_13025 [Yersinia ruckeri]|nr:hypothetical protein NJ56_13025 [Yersinia ruckeri]